MKARGQMSLFFLMGGFILVIFIILTLVSQPKIPALSNPTQIQPVVTFIEGCMEQTTVMSVNTILEQGFNAYVEKNREYNGSTIPVYSLSTNVLVEGFETTELLEFINEKMYTCIDNFAPLTMQGLSVEAGSLSTIPFVHYDLIEINLDYPIVISQANNKHKISRFHTNVKNNYGKLIEVFREIFFFQNEDPFMICLSCLENVSRIHNVHISIVNEGESWIYHVNDLESDLYFVFAYHHGKVSCQSIPESLPQEVSQRIIADCLSNEVESNQQNLVIDPIETQVAYLGEEFQVEVRSNIKDLVFSDFTHLFDISDSGSISFIPAKEDVGTHTIWIKAQGSQGTRTYESFELKIK